MIHARKIKLLLMAVLRSEFARCGLDVLLVLRISRREVGAVVCDKFRCAKVLSTKGAWLGREMVIGPL